MSPVPTFDSGFSTPATSSIFSARSRVEAMCRFEAALAAAQAAIGEIPEAVAAEIEEICARAEIDAESLSAEGWDVGSPVIVLVDRLREQMTPAAAQALHRGATTQDVVDSAVMIGAGQALDAILGDLGSIARTCRTLATEYRDAPTIGRTFLQHARHTTFGLRAAQWLEAVCVARDTLTALRAELPVQLGGPVGNLSGLGGQPDRVVESVATRLGLAVPALPWHTDRSVVVRLVSMVDAAGGAMAKIASDLVMLSQTEVAEIRVRSGGSSAMPEKRNPIDAIRAMAAAEVCAGVSSVVTRGRPHELDRGVGGWHAEWFGVPVAIQAAAAAVSSIRMALETIEVDPRRMLTNLGTEPDPSAIAASARLVDRVLDRRRDNENGS